MSKPTTDQMQHTAVVSSRGASTEHSIRHMLREQKKHCASLHANPLFQEFWHRSKPPQDAQPPMIDDLEAEGQTRLFDVIRSAAEAREADRAGVWASFGQPYACLGEPKQLDTSAAALLPHLNRDDLAAAAAGPKQQQQQQQMQRRGGMRMSRTGSTGPNASAVAAAAALAIAAAEEGKTGAGGGTAAGAGSLSSSAPHADDAAKLLHHKTVIHFNSVDRLEASFPLAAVRQSEKRQKAAKVKPRRFFDKEGAEADLADAAASYGHHAIPSRPLPGTHLLQQHQTAAAAVAAHNAARDSCSNTHSTAAATGRKGRSGRGSHAAGAAAAAGDGQRHAFFITQQAPAGSSSATTAAGAAASADARASAAGCGSDCTPAAATAAAARRHSVSLCVEPDSGTLGRASTHSAGINPATSDLSGSQRPGFGPITVPTMQPIGTSSNPVTSWHNEFVGVRQAGYAELQETLWQRSVDRAQARGEPAAAAAFSKSLLQQLASTGGRFQPGWIPGTTPESPFAFATSQQQHQQDQAAGAAAQAAEVAAAAAGPRLKPAEVELLELFYASLCSLVERQRLSDPLSLTLVHKVKALLEGGTFLQPAMLQGCVDCVSEFSSSCGLRRHNRFVLPLLAFVRKCVGVSPAEFESMVAAAGIEPVIFEPQEPAELEAYALQQQQEADQDHPQQLEAVPEYGEVLSPPAAAAAADAGDLASTGVSAAVQRLSLSSAGGNRSRGGSAAGGTRPLLPLGRPASGAGSAAAAGVGVAPPAMTPGRAISTAAVGAGVGPSPLRLERCVSTATAGGHSPGPTTGRGGSSGGGCSSSGGTSRTREGSSSGASTGCGRGVSEAGVKPPEGPSVPGINAAAAAAAAEITAAIHSAPASQRALAAVAAGTAASGSIRVKVPGVAGPVELLPAAAAAPAAASADGGAGGREGEGGVGTGVDGGDGVDECVDGEEALPDLGLGEDGEPLSRKWRQQEGLASWGTLSPSAAAVAGGARSRSGSGGGAADTD